MKKQRLTIATSIFLAGGILLTGCSSNTPEAPTPTMSTSVTIESSAPTTAVPSESAKPTATPEKEMTDAELKAEGEALIKELEKNPLRIDIDSALKEYSTPEVAEYAKEYDVKAGIKTGLSFYQDITNVSNFYEKRDTSKDFDLINVAQVTDQLDSEHIADISADVKENKQFTGIFTVDSDAKFSHKNVAGKKTTYTVTNMPASSYNTPAISINSNNNLQINGWRYLTVPVKGATLEMKMGYSIEMVATDKDNFKVLGMAWSVADDGIKNVK